MNYDLYLFSCLLKLYDKEFEVLEYDYQFEELPSRFTEFLVSPFNRDTKGLYDCITDYLVNKYKK